MLQRRRHQRRRSYPACWIDFSGDILYGTAIVGGSSGGGTVFGVNIDGTGFTNLHNFIGSDGVGPLGLLVLSSNSLYGTASGGGSADKGTIFKINTDGTGFTTLHSFPATTGPLYTNSDGSGAAGLILSGNILYGTAHLGGSAGNGTLFKINTDGTSFTTLHSFAATPGSPPYINGDGASPSGNLILSGDTLYGTTYYGGDSGYGTVFAVKIDGTDFRTIYSFTALSGLYDGINSDGAFPSGNLVLATNTLYGTAGGGGSSSNGTVFKLNTDGTGFVTLYSFTSLQDNGSPNETNSDGSGPIGLILLNGSLYGTAQYGGSGGVGTLFALGIGGTGFTNLHNFISNGGAYPNGVILSGKTLYGTTSEGGGSGGEGTVFSLTLPGPPQLTVLRYGANAILTWPTNAAGFNLQSTTNLVSPAVWTTVSPDPVVANGQNTVTNPISGSRQFYRLSQ